MSFATTHWTQVLQARGSTPEARAALHELCVAYYEPVREYLQKATFPGQDPEDLAQGFFTYLLAGRPFETVDPQRGRFRAFLLGATKHFVLHQQEHAHAQKRGGVFKHTCLDDHSVAIEIPTRHRDGPEAQFDRAWAFTVLDRAITRLKNDMLAAGRGVQFQVLQPWLTGDDSTSHARAAEQLGVSLNAVKVALYRLRAQFRDCIREEIALTVADPAERESELADLKAALRV